MKRNQIYALAIVAALSPGGARPLGQRIVLPGHPRPGPGPGEDIVGDTGRHPDGHAEQR